MMYANSNGVEAFQACTCRASPTFVYPMVPLLHQFEICNSLKNDLFVQRLSLYRFAPFLHVRARRARACGNTAAAADRAWRV